MAQSNAIKDREFQSFVDSPTRDNASSREVVAANTIGDPVNVVDVGFAIEDFSLSNNEVSEGLNNQSVGTLSVDFGGLAPFAFELTSNPNNLFKIENGNELKTNALIDFNTNPSVDIEITLTDSAKRTVVKDFTITILETAFANTTQTEFNGVDEYITFGSNLRFQRTDTFSISFWFEIDDISGTQVIVGNQRSSSTFAGYSVYNNEGQLSVDFYRSFSPSSYITIETTTAVISTNTKYHCCVTYDGSSTAGGFTIYLDGVSQNVTAVNNTLSSGSILYDDANFQISGISGANFLYDGTVDELSVYSTELTLSQVADIYNSGTILDVSNLNSFSDCLAWFRMGENSTAPNLSDEISGNSATMVNMNSSNFVSV